MARPPKPINWDLVEKFIEEDCNGVEIASYFNVIPETFYERFQKEYEESFTSFSSKKTPSGRALIKHAQFQAAMKGNPQMLVLLGKLRLGQKDISEINNIDSSITVNIVNYAKQYSDESNNTPPQV